MNRFPHRTLCESCAMPGLDWYESRDDVSEAAQAFKAGGSLCEICRALNSARTEDPITSKLGAADAAGRSGSQRHRLLTAFAAGRAMTADEAMRAAGLSERSCYWKRVSELREAGMLALTGRERPGEQGSSQAESEITPEGLAALRRTTRQ